MDTDTAAEPILSDSELVLQFESLGDSCELGLVQRMVGVEPLGMFRFAGTPLRHLVRALDARFEGMAEPDQVRLQPENGEYMIKLTKYDFIYHAHVKIGEADPVSLHRQQIRTVRFLIEKLISDLENPEKIMVFRQNEDLAANDLLDFRRALAAYGPSTLLWVQPTRFGYPPGTVVVVDDTLMIGYVSRLSPRENAPDLDLQSWLSVLRRAHALRPDRNRTPSPVSAPPPNPVPARATRVDIEFGKDGNALALTGEGWSGLEDGYTWTIDDGSVLTIPVPQKADRYWLEMEVVPFVAPPAVMAQTMAVAINGEVIHIFDPVIRGTIGCAVPGRLLDGKDAIEIVLAHPGAATPREAAGEDDDRRLAVAFSRLSLFVN